MKYILILLSVSIYSCTTVLDVNIPDRPAKLTLNCIFTPDSTWKVALTTDNSILDNSDFFTLVNDASVIVYQDGNPVDTLILKKRDSRSSTNAYNYYSRTLKPFNTRPYEIRATSPRFGSVRAVSAIPDSTTITNAFAHLSLDATGESTVTLTFKDRGNEKNYYFVYVSQKFDYYYKYDTLHGDGPLIISTNDPAFQNNHSSDQGLLFDDGLFDGKAITIQTTLHYYYPYENEEVRVHLRTVSADLYNYLTTSDLQTQSSGDFLDHGTSDPLAQPTIVFSNIEGGHGIFAGYSETSVRVH